MRRLRIGTLVVLVLFTVIAGRLVALQLTDARKYALEGLNGRLTTEVLFAPRGAIYDRNHHVLAQSVEARYVFADPSRIKGKDIPATAEALRSILGIPTSQLTPKLGSRTRSNGSLDQFEYLARRVSVEDGNRVMALGLAGIGVGQDEQRATPGNDLAANLIGFTGNDGSNGDSLHGRVGLEAGYDDLLSGTDGSRTFEVGAGDLDTAIPGGYDETKSPHPGSSLELTIDQDVQYKVQQILATEMANRNVDFACAVVLSVHTGEVLAQASYPDYSVQDPGSSTAASRTDSCSQQAVDPGSVHKVITLGAALQTGAAHPDTTVTLPGSSISKGGATYADTTPLSKGTKITIPGILAYSSHVGAIMVADQMTPQTLYDYQVKFGLGKVTGEGMPGESAGLVQPPANWSASSYGSIPIGMGVSVTPLQMAAAYATIANNGVYIQPHLIKGTVSPDGKEHPATTPVTRTVLSAQNAQTLRQDLEAVVVAPHATGHKAAISQYRVAGKTGTGALVRNGKYAPGEVGSFIGMAPEENPQYVIAVFVHSPSGGEGGDTSAPSFQQMMTFTLQHYGVPPTGSKPPTFTLTE
jgi:cell division protein FtsI (penicillin-binding protein 3)